MNSSSGISKILIWGAIIGLLYWLWNSEKLDPILEKYGLKDFMKNKVVPEVDTNAIEGNDEAQEDEVFLGEEEAEFKLPDSSWTKVQIQEFMIQFEIEFTGKETKDELLKLIEEDGNDH